LLVIAVLTLSGGSAKSGGIVDEHGDEGDTVFFGTVKDTRGVAIEGAHVNVKSRNIEFVTTTDAIGNYRLVTQMDPDQSELSCKKEGYRQSGIVRRSAPGASSPIEIDCMLQAGR
jgi:hypothetical protein